MIYHELKAIIIMTREELEKLWPILEAYRQGKTIEVYKELINL